VDYVPAEDGETEAAEQNEAVEWAKKALQEQEA